MILLLDAWDYLCCKQLVAAGEETAFRHAGGIAERGYIHYG
jgi:hypothetical protein